MPGMKRPSLRRLSFAFIFLLMPLTASAQQVVVTPDHADGVYQVGDPIRWHIEWTGDAAPDSIVYTIKKGGLTDLSSGTIALSKGSADIETELEMPGTLLLELKAKSSEGKSVRALGGAVAGPDKITPSAPRPDDFDAFWGAKLKELAAVDPDPHLEKVKVSTPGVGYYKLTMNNIRGTHIQGQLARPTAGEKFPALLIVQWAGVYEMKRGWAVDRAAEGWLVLNISAHDLPINESEEFYKQQLVGPLKNYWEIHNDDRDASYYLRMYLSCYRAAEYLTQRPDWDGKTLVVMGASQGGQQSLVTAALHPKITAALAAVPAGCDMLGPAVGRQGGFPQWYSKTDSKDPAKVRDASRYYDVVNFAPRIKCPVLIGLGLIDETCPPEGVLAAVNQISAPKEVIILPHGDHHGADGSDNPYGQRCWGAWLPALRQGQPAPVKQ
jgi:cephalosporin-C deacetylase-like acetyl esterase